MLPPSRITQLEKLSQLTMSKLTEWILDDIARRIAEAGTISSSAEYQIWRLKNLGISERKILAQLNKRLGVTKAQLVQMVKDAGQEGYTIDVNRLTGTQKVDFVNNEWLQNTLEASAQLTSDTFDNITNTLGLVMPNGINVPLTQAYVKLCDMAFMQVATGATDYQTAYANATKNLAKYGVRTIDYTSGQSTNIEVAVRRSVMGGIGLLQEKISDHNHDELGADGWEISAHEMSAPDHEPIQGRQYTDAQYTALNNSLKRRIGTLNCGHVAFPIIIGLNKPMYTEQELQDMKNRNASGVTYNGKHYTKYEAGQQQRAMERAMRAQKRAIINAKAFAKVTGDDSIYKIADAKLTRLYDEYNRFSKACGLRPQYGRMEIGVKV